MNHAPDLQQTINLVNSDNQHFEKHFGGNNDSFIDYTASMMKDIGSIVF